MSARERITQERPEGATHLAVVTFTSHPNGDDAERQEVGVWLYQPVDNAKNLGDLEELAWEAAELWPGSNWATDDDDNWWVSKIEILDAPAAGE